jgi:hypothetical protein
MIKNILILLKELDAYNVSMEVEVAKGLFHIPETFSEGLEKTKRKFKYKNKDL